MADYVGDYGKPPVVGFEICRQTRNLRTVRDIWSKFGVRMNHY